MLFFSLWVAPHAASSALPRPLMSFGFPSATSNSQARPETLSSLFALGLPHPAPSLLKVSHLLKGLLPVNLCGLVSCHYRSWDFEHLRSFSHIGSRDRLRPFALVTLQHHDCDVFDDAWIHRSENIIIQHLAVPLCQVLLSSLSPTKQVPCVSPLRLEFRPLTSL